MARTRDLNRRIRDQSVSPFVARLLQRLSEHRPNAVTAVHSRPHSSDEVGYVVDLGLEFADQSILKEIILSREEIFFSFQIVSRYIHENNGGALPEYFALEFSDQSYTLQDLTDELEKLTRILKALEDCLRELGVGDARRPNIVRDVELFVRRAARPTWAERFDFPELRRLSAPAFLKKVHAEEISPEGHVSKEVIRHTDPALLLAVNSYLSQRARRSAGPGDFAGMTFVTHRKPRSKLSTRADQIPTGSPATRPSRPFRPKSARDRRNERT